MYEPFFGLHKRPFPAAVDTTCGFAAQSFQTVLGELVSCVERGRGIALLTAPAGLGKTLVCQRLAEELGPRFHSIVLGNAGFSNPRSLLQAVLFELGQDFSQRDENELRLTLRAWLNRLRPEREALVLILDEAHLLHPELIEEVRTLTDLAQQGQPLVRVVLSGQLELEERLTSRVFDALNQRVAAHTSLEPFTRRESLAYLHERVSVSGAAVDDVFSAAALDLITRASGGVPRCLNQLADHSLLLSYAADERPVTEATVRSALDDLKQLPLQWHDAAETWTPSTDEDSDADVPSDEAGERNADCKAPVAEVEACANSSQAAAAFEFGADEAAAAPADSVHDALSEQSPALARWNLADEATADEPAVNAATAPQGAVGHHADHPALERDPLAPFFSQVVTGISFDIPSAMTTRPAALECEVVECEAEAASVGESASSAAVDGAAADEAAWDEVTDAREEIESAGVLLSEATGPAAFESVEPAPSRATPQHSSADLQIEVIHDPYLSLLDPEQSHVAWDHAASLLVMTEATAPLTASRLDADSHSAVTTALETATPDDELPPVTLTETSDAAAELAVEQNPDQPAGTDPMRRAQSLLSDLRAQFGLDPIEPDHHDAALIRDSDDEDLSRDEPASFVNLQDDAAAFFDEAGPAVDETDDEPLPAAAAEHHDEQPLPREAHPDRYIEAILPLIEELAGTDESDVSDSRDIAADLLDIVADPGEDLEDEIGSEVLELYLDTKARLHALTSRLEERSDAAPAGSSPPDQPLDVVLPETEAGLPPDVRRAEPESTGAPSGDRVDHRFGRLFSELRRRHGAR